MEDGPKSIQLLFKLWRKNIIPSGMRIFQTKSFLISRILVAHSVDFQDVFETLLSILTNLQEASYACTFDRLAKKITRLICFSTWVELHPTKYDHLSSILNFFFHENLELCLNLCPSWLEMWSCPCFLPCLLLMDKFKRSFWENSFTISLMIMLYL